MVDFILIINEYCGGKHAKKVEPLIVDRTEYTNTTTGDKTYATMKKRPRRIRPRKKSPSPPKSTVSHMFYATWLLYVPH